MGIVYTSVCRKKHLPLNSYVSLYEDSEQVGEGRSLPLIDTIESSKENDPEVLYFGKEYGLHIESHEGEGTCTTICIPTGRNEK